MNIKKSRDGTYHIECSKDELIALSWGEYADEYIGEYKDRKLFRSLMKQIEEVVNGEKE